MNKVNYLLSLFESEDFELSFKHKGRPAVAVFDLVDPGHKGGDNDPESYASTMKFEKAYYTDQDEQVDDLSSQEIEDLENKASDSFDTQEK